MIQKDRWEISTRYNKGNFHREGGEILERRPREVWDFYPWAV